MSTGPLRILQVAAEVFPLVKTGGLADVLGALPQAMAAAGHDVRLVLPGLPPIVEAVLHLKEVARLGPMFGAGQVTVRLGRMPYSKLPVYVVDAPWLYRRSGGPYQDAAGAEWPDNLQRFALLGWVAAHLAGGDVDADWTADILHAHDWHAALACAYLATHACRVRSVFTIHNLAFQGLFPAGDFPLLQLPARQMAADRIEFHGQLSFMKAGLKLADHLTTVSPSYAREITTHAFGAGLEGVLQQRTKDLSGILNGVDQAIWNPSTDTALVSRYDRERLKGKLACKRALQARFGLSADATGPLFGMVSRLSHQKGVDLLLAAAPAVLQAGGQLVVQGTGDAALQAGLLQLCAEHPGAVGIEIGYDEQLAHRIMAGTDAVLVPSRFEPCGLTQLYGLRYGSLPVVRRVGGLADTVTDVSPGSLASGRATGFVFDAAEPSELQETMLRAVQVFRQSPAVWRMLMRQAMGEDHSWSRAAQQYLALFQRLVTP